MKAQIKKTAVMSLALVAMTFFTFSTASAQRGNQGGKQKTKKTVVTKRKVVTQKNQGKRGNARTQGNRGNQRKQVANYPRGSKQLVHRGINYRVSGNQYYRMQRGRYVRVSPPRGLYFNSPPSFVRVNRHGRTMYRNNGRYYSRQRNNLGQFFFTLVLG